LFGLSVAALLPQGLSTGEVSYQIDNPVELNHLVIVVDSATYESILSSTFLSTEFANGGVQTVTAGPDESWTARYIMGENLYLEIFGPRGREGRDPGYVGLAFSTVSSGEIESVYARLRRSAGERAHVFLRTRQVQDDQRPWFQAVSVDPPSMNRRLGAWVLEWTQDHLKALAFGPDQTPSRREYLRALRQARGVAMPAPDRLLADVRRIDLALTTEERHDLELLLQAGGWRQIEMEGDTVRLYRPGLDLFMVTDEAPSPRLRSIEFSLTHPATEAKEMQFGGRSTLMVRTDASARWTFH